MLLKDIIAAFLVALIISAVFSVGFKHRGPWGTIGVFFLVIFMAVWASQLWISPIGPLFYGVAWLPIFCIGLVFAFALVAPDISKRNVVVSSPEAAVFGIFFWLLLTVLVLAIISGYYNQYYNHPKIS